MNPLDSKRPWTQLENQKPNILKNEIISKTVAQCQIKLEEGPVIFRFFIFCNFSDNILATFSGLKRYDKIHGNNWSIFHMAPNEKE